MKMLNSQSAFMASSWIKNKNVTNFPKINEWHDAKLLKKNKWPSFSKAINARGHGNFNWKHL